MKLKTTADWFKAVEAGDAETVTEAIEKFKSFADTNGETALMQAVRKRDTALVTILAPHECSWATQDGYTALMLAALNDAEDLCKILVMYEGSYVLADGTTALMLAVCNGSLNAAETLIHHQADIRDNQSRTALVRAVEAKQTKAVKLILRSWVHMIKADVEEALSVAQRFDLADMCYILAPYLASTTPVHSSTYSAPEPGKLPRKTTPAPAGVDKSNLAVSNLLTSKLYVPKDAFVMELEQKAKTLNEIVTFINAQTKLSSLTATDVIDYLATVFSRNYILTAEKDQLQEELKKAQRVIQDQALEIESSRIRSSSARSAELAYVGNISIIGAANETYTRTLSDVQEELSRCRIDLEEERVRVSDFKSEEQKLTSYINLKLGTKALGLKDLKYVLGNCFDQLDAIRDENTSLHTDLVRLRTKDAAEALRPQTGSAMKELVELRSKLLAKETELEILRKTISDVRVAQAELITDSDILRAEMDKFKSKQTVFFSKASDLLRRPCKSYEDVMSALHEQRSDTLTSDETLERELTAIQNDNTLLRKILNTVRADQQTTTKYVSEILATISSHQRRTILLPDANNVLKHVLLSDKDEAHDCQVNDFDLRVSNAAGLVKQPGLKGSETKTSGSTLHPPDAPSRNTTLSTLLELSTVQEEQHSSLVENKLNELESLRVLHEQTSARAERLEQELKDAHEQLSALRDAKKEYQDIVLNKAKLYDEAAVAVIDVADAKAQAANVVISYIMTIREENRRLRADLVLARERVSEQRLIDVLSKTDTTGQIDYLHREVTEHQHKIRMLTDNIDRIFDAIEAGMGQRYYNVDEATAGLTRHFLHVRYLFEQVNTLKSQESKDETSKAVDNPGPQTQYKEIYITATDGDIRKRNEAIVKLTDENDALKKEIEQLRPYQRFYNERKCEQCVLNAETIQKLNARIAASDKNTTQLNSMIAEKDLEIQRLKGEVAEHVSRQAELLATQPKICMTKASSRSDSARPGSAAAGRSKKSMSTMSSSSRLSSSITRAAPTSATNIATMTAKAQSGGLKALIQANPSADLMKFGTLPHEVDQLLTCISEVVEQIKRAKLDDRTMLKDWTRLFEKVSVLMAKLFKTTTDPQIAHKELEDCKHIRDMLKGKLPKT